MKINHWKIALESAVFDPAVGIRIAPLTTGDIFGTYVTEILPGKKVGAHYHQEGDEVYEIVRGHGTLYTATMHANQHQNPKVTAVTAGDFFNIESGIAHQLVNTGNEPLILIFGCPATHLGSDRVLVTDLMM